MVPVVKVQVKRVQPPVTRVWAVRQEVSVLPSSALPIWKVAMAALPESNRAKPVRVYWVVLVRA